MDKFFGTTVAPGKDVNVDIPAGHILRLTQLAITNASDKVSLVANVEGNNFTVATLNGGAKIFQVSTSLVFSPDQAPKLLAKGTGVIHVTGTLTNVGDTHIDDEDDMSLDEDDDRKPAKGGVRASDLSDDDSFTSSQMRALAEDGDLDDFDMDEEDLDDMDMDDDESLDEDAAANMAGLAKKEKSASPKQSPKLEAAKKPESPKQSPKQAAAPAPAAAGGDLDGEGKSPAFNSAIKKLESGKSFAELSDDELEALDEEGLLPDGEDDMPEDFGMMDEGMGDFDGLDDEDDLDGLSDEDDESEDLAPVPQKSASPKQGGGGASSPKQAAAAGSPRGSVGTGAAAPSPRGSQQQQQQNSAQRPSFGGRGGGGASSQSPSAGRGRGNGSQSPSAGGGRGGGNFSPNRGRGFGSPRGSR